MAEKISPALTPDEWANERHEMHEHEFDALWYSVRDDPSRALAAVMAKANDELPDGDARKITRAHLAVLDTAMRDAEITRNESNSCPADHAASDAHEAALAAFRALVAALLPPEAPRQAPPPPVIYCRGGPLDGRPVPYAGSPYVYRALAPRPDPVQVLSGPASCYPRTTHVVEHRYELWAEAPAGGGTHQQRVAEWYEYVNESKPPEGA